MKLHMIRKSALPIYLTGLISVISKHFQNNLFNINENVKYLIYSNNAKYIFKPLKNFLQKILLG